MNEIALQGAGALAILAAVGHGYLGDKTLSAQPIDPPRLKTFIRLCYQFGSLGWLAGGVLLFVIPSLMPTLTLSDERMWVVLILAPLYAFGAIINGWFTKGRHFGWVMLVSVVILALLGLG